jgi:hypothetical protein
MWESLIMGGVNYWGLKKSIISISKVLKISIMPITGV